MECVYGCCYLGRLHLTHFATDGTHLVAVAVVVKTGLIFRRTLKAVTDNQAQLHKQVQRVIQRGPAHGELIFHRQLLAQLVQ